MHFSEHSIVLRGFWHDVNALVSVAASKVIFGCLTYISFLKVLYFTYSAVASFRYFKCSKTMLKCSLLCNARSLNSFSHRKSAGCMAMGSKQIERVTEIKSMVER